MKIFYPHKTVHYHLQTFITWTPNFSIKEAYSFTKEELRQQDQELNDRLRVKVFEKTKVWLTNSSAVDLINILSGDGWDPSAYGAKPLDEMAVTMNGDNQKNLSTEDKAFYLIVKSYYEDGILVPENACPKLNISRVTFNRWLTGTSCPHSAVKDIVYDYILSLIENKP